MYIYSSIIRDEVIKPKVFDTLEDAQASLRKDFWACYELCSDRIHDVNYDCIVFSDNGVSGHECCAQLTPRSSFVSNCHGGDSLVGRIDCISPPISTNTMWVYLTIDPYFSQFIAPDAFRRIFEPQIFDTLEDAQSAMRKDFQYYSKIDDYIDDIYSLLSTKGEVSYFDYEDFGRDIDSMPEKDFYLTPNSVHVKDPGPQYGFLDWRGMIFEYENISKC